jgi:hypothetical protein
MDFAIPAFPARRQASPHRPPYWKKGLGIVVVIRRLSLAVDEIKDDRAPFQGQVSRIAMSARRNAAIASGGGA